MDLYTSIGLVIALVVVRDHHLADGATATEATVGSEDASGNAARQLT